MTIVRYASVEKADRDIMRSLFGERQQGPLPKENYKGADLYRWVSGFGQVVCQSGAYVIEIEPDSTDAAPWVMKFLDVVLAELPAASPPPK